MNTSNTTPKQKAITWWNNLGNEGIKAMMRKYGIEWHTTKPAMYKAISDKGILNIYLKEHYKIQCSQTANLIEANLTIEQAKQMVAEWEEQDKAEGIYKRDCYEIVQMFEA